MKYIHIHPLDNVVVALEDLKKGDLVSVTATPPAGLQSTEVPAGLPSAKAPAGIQKAASVEGTFGTPRQQCPLRAARLPGDRNLQGWRDTLINTKVHTKVHTKGN